MINGYKRHGGQVLHAKGYKNGQIIGTDPRRFKSEYSFKKDFTPLWCTQPTAVERLGSDPI